MDRALTGPPPAATADAAAPGDDVRPTVAAKLRLAADRFGEHDYVVDAHDRVTYLGAERRSAEVADQLVGLGVGKGTRVGLLFPSGVDAAVWWLAVTRIGAVAVPISTFSAPGELAVVLRLADVSLLVAPHRILTIDVAERLEQALPGLATSRPGRLELPAAPYLRRVVLLGEAGAAWAGTWPPPDHDAVHPGIRVAIEDEVFPADLAVIVHTSGSTAEPKGVVHTHGGLLRQSASWPSVMRALLQVDGAPCILCAMPFFWIGGLLALGGALQEKAKLVVLPRLDAGLALDLAERERVNGVVGWPEFTQKLRLHPSFDERDLSAAPTLRNTPADLAMLGSPDGHPVHRGMTETGGSFACTDVRVVDPDGADVDVDVVGELLVRGVGMMAGYNKRERAEVFDADGWFHTRDRVYRKADDPRLFYVGRDSELIKTSGANVSPREVEAVIEEFGDIAHCVVVGVAHTARDEEVCAVVVAAGRPPDVDDLTARVRQHLAPYKVPTRWIVVAADEVPSLGSGKPDRRRLRDLVSTGVLR